jgi:prephenate dehydrogenase
MIRIGGFGEAGSIFAAALARAGAAVDSYDRL